MDFNRSDCKISLVLILSLIFSTSRVPSVSVGKRLAPDLYYAAIVALLQDTEGIACAFVGNFNSGAGSSTRFRAFLGELERVLTQKTVIYAEGALCSTSVSHARYITGMEDSELRDGLLYDSPKKLTTFVLKLTPKGKTNELNGEEQADESGKRKKSRENMKIMSSESRGSADKLSELRVLQELANVRVPNSMTPVGQHNFTEGSIALGKVGNKKAGRLRFRISSGAIFSPSRSPEAHPIESLLKGTGYNTSHDEIPSSDTEKEVPGKMAEKPDDDYKTGSNPHPEESNVATEDVEVANNERASTAVKKATVLKMFKNVAQQFDALQDLFAEDACDCSNDFNRSRTRMTLENISNNQGNFTRVRFIRRKVTEKDKKPNMRSMEQLVADDEY